MSHLSRRDCLRLGLVGATAGAIGGCAKIADRFSEHHTDPDLPAGKTSEAKRLLDRVGFGPRPGDIAQVKRMGREAFVDAALRADAGEEMRLQFLLNRLDVFQMDPYEAQDLPENEVLRQLQISAILRATFGSNQLLERMVDFWTNHFNIYGRKGLAAYRKAADETNVIRKNALGSFPDMLSASAHSSAMLIYLDNQSNVDGRPNENYAREIMELHTLGVKGGYTQRDVQEVARCFTGWTIERRFLRHRWAFRFDEDRHDNSVKRVLGHTIPAGGGEHDADIVLGILAHHPATAKHLAEKLCAYFLGSAGDAWVQPTAKAYLESRGDIRAMLRPILKSSELLSSPPILKRPFDYMVSAMRALDAETDGGSALQEHLSKMGEPLYQWPMPDGYPTRTASWTGTMLPRWNFALALAGNRIGGTNVDWHALLPAPEPERLFELTHAARPEPEDRELFHRVDAELKQEEDGRQTAGFLCLASPKFQWR